MGPVLHVQKWPPQDMQTSRKGDSGTPGRPFRLVKMGIDEQLVFCIEMSAIIDS